MPRADEPRVTIRLSEVDHAVLRAAADAAGIKLGSLIREAAMAYAREVASSAGGSRMRRRSAAVPVPPPAAPLPEVEVAPSVGFRDGDVAENARTGEKLRVRLGAEPLPAGVQTARELAFERQRKLNERRGS